MFRAKLTKPVRSEFTEATMKTNEFDWNGGQVTFWDLDLVSDLSPLSHQVELLKEDLAQAQYPNGCVLDVGWYPEFSPDGHFAVAVIKADNWEKPIHYCECKTVSDLRTAISNALQTAIGVL